MNIGIDVDGTLADMMPGTLQVLENETGINVRLEDYTSWTYLQDTYNFDSAEVLGFMDEAWLQGLVTLLEPGIQVPLHAIHKRDSTITIITQRTRPSHWIMTKWLLDNGIPYDALVFSTGLNKMDYPIDVLIDDSPFQADVMDRYPDKVLYSLAQTWNVPKIPAKNVVYIKSVTEALGIIERGAR